jgi:phospholipid transport system substrate-binding protein
MKQRESYSRILLGLALVATSGLARAAQAEDPLATIKRNNTEVSRLLRQKTEPNTPQEKKKNDEIKALAASLLDYGELGRRAMDSHWEKLTADQRDRFNDKFRELLEKKYVKQLKSNLDYKVSYQGQQIAGQEATVTTTVKINTKGKSTDSEIIYKMKRAGEKWMVYDVINDEESTVRLYKGQFNKEMNNGGFDKLIKLIETRIKAYSS